MMVGEVTPGHSALLPVVQLRWVVAAARVQGGRILP